MSSREERESLSIRIVHAGERYVVIEKPSGMLSVPGIGEEKADCAAARVRAEFARATGPLVVHRLDMETSGLMVFGLDPGAQRELSAQFEARDVEKSYTALVEGIVVRDEGEIDLPLRLDVYRRPYQVVDQAFGRPAVTRFRVVSRETDRTRVRFMPVTGRTHQLRVHAAHPATRGGLGHAILGDVLYGSGLSAEAPRLMLHAGELAFREPGTQRRVRWESAAPF